MKSEPRQPALVLEATLTGAGRLENHRSYPHTRLAISKDELSATLGACKRRTSKAGIEFKLCTEKP